VDRGAPRQSVLRFLEWGGEALETPGHTVESISLLVYDGAQLGSQAAAPDPVAVLTGDTLFVGDVGRPDLRASLGWSASELGGMLYDSLHGKLLKLPDTTKVYPAHGAGSLCGKAISKETVSTIGDQRLLNYALQPMTKERFIELVTADQPDAPAYFTYDAVLNSRERQTLDQALARELKPLTLQQLQSAVEDGAQLLDTRDPAEFAAAHLRGSVNIGLGGQYASWAGTLLDPSRPIVIVADPAAETQSALRLGRIGFDRVEGFLDGGLAAAADVVTTERLSPQTAAQRIAAPNAPTVIATWRQGDATLTLNQSPYSGTFSLIITSIALEALARKAQATAVTMDAREAPAREAARAKEQADAARAGAEKTRTTNKDTFKP